jgi:hypothetical protein
MYLEKSHTISVFCIICQFSAHEALLGYEAKMRFLTQDKIYVYYHMSGCVD